MRNEERFVSDCLDSVLLQLNDLTEYEIFCVDGLSSDNTRNIVLEYVNKDNRILLIENKHKIVPIAMNMAIRLARGDVIIRMDCHARYNQKYINNCLEVLNRTNADNVGGYIETVPADDSKKSRAIAVSITSRFGVGGSKFRIGGDEQEVDTVPFGCFRKDVFERFGLYDERLARCQDIEFNSRIRANRGKIIISPSIKSIYYSSSSFSDLWKKKFNTGLWVYYTFYLVGGGLRVRHFVPLFFVLSILILSTAGFFFNFLWLFLISELFLYLFIAVVESIRLARNTKSSSTLVLISFIQMHIGYGIGSLWGILTAPFKFGFLHKRLHYE